MGERSVMMRTRLRLAVLLTLALAAPAPAAIGKWISQCTGISHVANDDPILMPGQPGEFMHRHQFIGNRTTGANSTTASLLAAKCTPPNTFRSTCRGADDTSAYWTPTVSFNGKEVAPQDTPGINIAYSNVGMPAGAFVVAPPAGLRYITGNAHAENVSENAGLGTEIFYQCDAPGALKGAMPPATCPVGTTRLKVVIGFPFCWNGVASGGNDTANVIWPPGYLAVAPSPRACPATHPLYIPHISVEMLYGLAPTPGALTVVPTVMLSSGPPYTLHADFFNAWQDIVASPSGFSILISRCVNAGKNCGVQYVTPCSL